MCLIFTVFPASNVLKFFLEKLKEKPKQTLCALYESFSECYVCVMFLIQYCYRKTCELSLEMFLIKCMVHIYMTFSQITIFFPSKELKLRDCKLFSTQAFQWCFRKNQSSRRKNSSTVENFFFICTRSHI